MQATTDPKQNNFAMSDPLTNRFFLSPQERNDKDKGKEILKAFYAQQTAEGGGANYFRGRSLKFTELLLWAKGTQDMREFMDQMNISREEGKKAYVNIDFTPSHIGPQFLGTVVESYAKFKAYPCVKAIDDGSLTEKENRLLEGLYRMRHVQEIDALQKESGLQLEPAGVFVPDDELSARVYYELEDRLPKEIRFEKRLQKLQNDLRFEEVANPRTLRSLVTLNFASTKIEKLANGAYTVRICTPSNMVYNFFLSDTGELEVTMIGEFYSLKVREFRSKFGKTPERPEGLTEGEIFELAKLSTQKAQGQFNWHWSDQWGMSNYNHRRPYDDANILVLDAEINFEEEQYFVSKKDSYGREDIQLKKSIPGQQVKKDGTIIQQPLAEGTEIIKRPKNTWMRGVYAPYADKMLYWGRPDLIITPYTNTAKPLSSYTIVIPNNDGEYVPSLFARIMAPLKKFQLAELKQKQLIAKLTSSGWRIDVEAARNIDLGTGDSIAWEEVVRIKDQTGVELYSSKGVDPLQPSGPAISPGASNDDIQKIIGLNQTMAGIVMDIRQLIGVPQYRDGADVGDRTAAQLQQGQLQSSFNVTDFIPRANNSLWQETFYKICLLHWNDDVRAEPESKDDLLNTRFDLKLKMKASDYEKQQLEADIQRYSQVPDANGQPSLTLKDAQVLREVMETDPKLAQWYLTKTYEENRKKASQEAARREQANGQIQQQSLLAKAEQDKQLQRDKLEADKELEEFKGRIEKEKLLLQVFGNAVSKDESGSLIKVFLPAIQQLVPNISLPLQKENEEMVAQTQQEQAAAEQQQMAAMQQMQGQQMPPSNSPEMTPQDAQQ